MIDVAWELGFEDKAAVGIEGVMLAANAIHDIIRNLRNSPVSPRVKVVWEPELGDAGQYRFRGDAIGAIHVNLAQTRLVPDVSFVLLHEWRHALQHHFLGYSAMCKAALRPDGDWSFQIESDADAWAFKMMRIMKARKPRLIHPKSLDTVSIYKLRLAYSKNPVLLWE